MPTVTRKVIKRYKLTGRTIIQKLDLHFLSMMMTSWRDIERIYRHDADIGNVPSCWIKEVFMTQINTEEEKKSLRNHVNHT